MTRDVLEAEATLPDGRAYLSRRHRRLRPVGQGEDPGGRARQGGRGDPGRGPRPPRRWTPRRACCRATARPRASSARPGRECVVVANKIDRREGSEGEGEAWELGFPEVYGVSAEHGIGVDDMQAAIARAAAGSGGRGERRAEADEAPGREIALAVVGRPNVGKSSLVNALLGEERAIVSEIAGTTRDSVDARLEAAGRRFRLVDTAGIRRTRRTEQGPEVLSVVQARKRIEECDVALLVVDASEGPTGQDASVASYADEAGKGLVLVANKWDLAGRARGGDGRGLPGGRSAIADPVRPPRARAPDLGEDGPRGLAASSTTAARVAENRPPADLDGRAQPRPRPGAARQGAAHGLGPARSRSSTSRRRRSRRRPSRSSPAAPSRCTSPRSAASRTCSARRRTSPGSPIRIHVRERSGAARGRDARGRSKSSRRKAAFGVD